MSPVVCPRLLFSFQTHLEQLFGRAFVFITRKIKDLKISLLSLLKKIILYLHICMDIHVPMLWVFGGRIGEADICVFDLRRDLVGWARGVSTIVPQQGYSSNLERNHRAKAYFSIPRSHIFTEDSIQTSFRLPPFKRGKLFDWHQMGLTIL